MKTRNFTVAPFLIGVLAVVSPTDRSFASEIIGFTRPIHTIELAASETGRLALLNVQRGQSVSKGQLLGELDSEVLTARRKLAQARLESTANRDAAQITLDRTERKLQKLVQLQEEGHGSQEEVEYAESEKALAETQLREAEHVMRLNRLEVERIEAEIRRRLVRSPIDGVVLDVHREVGEYVSASDPHVVTLANLNQLLVRFFVPAAFGERLSEDQTVAVRFVHSGKRGEGTIHFLAPVIDADSNTIQIEVLLENEQRQFRSGRRCVLIIENNHRQARLP